MPITISAFASARARCPWRGLPPCARSAGASRPDRGSAATWIWPRLVRRRVARRLIALAAHGHAHAAAQPLVVEGGWLRQALSLLLSRCARRQRAGRPA